MSGGGAFRGLCLAGGFLTRLPFPHPNAQVGDFGWALAWFPCLGLILGATFCAVARVATAWTAGFGTVAVVLCHVVVTGALHLDGVADVCDAAGSGRAGRSELLAVMRDPRVGAMGVTGLLCALGARSVLTAEVVAAGQLWPLLAAPVVSRLAVVLWLAAMPYVGGDGLGSRFKTEARPWHVGLAVFSTAAFLSPLGWLGFALVLGAGGGSSLVAHWSVRRLRGLTGDVYGACIESGEVAALGVGAGLAARGWLV